MRTRSKSDKSQSAAERRLPGYFFLWHARGRIHRLVVATAKAFQRTQVLAAPGPRIRTITPRAPPHGLRSARGTWSLAIRQTLSGAGSRAAPGPQLHPLAGGCCRLQRHMPLGTAATVVGVRRPSIVTLQTLRYAIGLVQARVGVSRALHALSGEIEWREDRSPGHFGV